MPALPLDVFLDILPYLDNLTASHLLLTCRDVYSTCRSSWYRTPRILFAREASVGLTVASCRVLETIAFSRFLRTVISEPSLAAHIQELTLGCIHYEHRFVRRGNIEASYAENAFLDAIDNPTDLLSMSFPQPVDLPKFPEKYGVLFCGELLHLLLFLPNLKTLHLTDGKLQASSLQFAAFHQLSTSQHPVGLQNLQKLTISPIRWVYLGQDANELYSDAYNTIPLFSLPALRLLRIIRLVDEGPNWKWLPFIEERLWNHGESSVTDLAIVDSDVHPTLLSTLLVLPHELHALEISIQPAEEHRHGFDWDAVFSSLCVHSSTLTSLDVFSLTTHDHSPEAGPTIGTLDSLAHFSVLEHVRLPARALLGPARDESNDVPERRILSSLLPRSLRTLEIRLSWPWDLRYFMDRTSCPDAWLAEKAGVLPNLETFVVKRYGGDDAAQRAGPEVAKAFEDAGIEVIPPLGSSGIVVL